MPYAVSIIHRNSLWKAIVHSKWIIVYTFQRTIIIIYEPYNPYWNPIALQTILRKPFARHLRLQFRALAINGNFFVWSCAYFIPTCVDNKQRNSANMKYFDGFYAFIISTMDKYESMSLAKYSIYISNSSHKHHYSHCWEFLSNWYYWAFIPNSRKTFSFSLPQIICLTFILEVNPVFVVALSFIYQKFIVEYDDVSVLCVRYDMYRKVRTEMRKFTQYAHKLWMNIKQQFWMTGSCTKFYSCSYSFAFKLYTFYLKNIFSVFVGVFLFLSAFCICVFCIKLKNVCILYLKYLLSWLKFLICHNRYL